MVFLFLTLCTYLIISYLLLSYLLVSSPLAMLEKGEEEEADGGKGEEKT
jgi:hypothetical protein